MRPTHSRHGEPDAHTSGAVMGHRRHQVFASLFFVGRRRRVFARLAAVSGARPGDRVLDVGCGTGHFTRRMAKAVAPGGSAQGVDPSGDAIAQARHRTRLPDCTFTVGVAEALDAADATYDIVVSSLMIHHLPDGLRTQALGEMLRVLRPGGSVLVAEFRPPATRLGRRLVKAHSPAMAANRVDLLAPMVRDAGFEQLHTGDLRPWIHYVQAIKPHRPPEQSTGPTGRVDS
jgi:ubiquinone/menaquinone biosynthesis C-methylase UbiE